MVRVLEALRELADKEMKSEHSNHYCGGNATIALFLTNTIPLTGDERMQAIHHAEQLRRWAPGKISTSTNIIQASHHSTYSFVVDNYIITLTE